MIKNNKGISIIELIFASLLLSLTCLLYFSVSSFILNSIKTHISYETALCLGKNIIEQEKNKKYQEIKPGKSQSIVSEKFSILKNISYFQNNKNLKLIYVKISWREKNFDKKIKLSTIIGNFNE